MEWIKGVCLFGLSFGVVFCAVCFANAQEESAPAPQGGFALAKDIATNAGTVIFGRTEEFRATWGDYFEAKYDAAAAERALKQEEIVREVEKDGADLDKLIEEPRPIVNQLKDSSGIIEGFKVQSYKALSFIFNTAYVFYGIIALIVLWLLRKIWKLVRGY